MAPLKTLATLALSVGAVSGFAPQPMVNKAAVAAPRYEFHVVIMVVFISIAVTGAFLMKKENRSKLRIGIAGYALLSRTRRTGFYWYTSPA